MQSEIWKPLWVAICYHVLSEGETGVGQTQREGWRWGIRGAQRKQGGIICVVVPDGFLGPRSCPSGASSLSPVPGVCLINSVLAKHAPLGICSLPTKHLWQPIVLRPQEVNHPSPWTWGQLEGDTRGWGEGSNEVKGLFLHFWVITLTFPLRLRLRHSPLTQLNPLSILRWY